MDRSDLESHKLKLSFHLSRGAKISAVKIIRAMTGCGLLEAVMVYDALHPNFIPPSEYNTPSPASDNAQYIVAMQRGSDDNWGVWLFKPDDWREADERGQRERAIAFAQEELNEQGVGDIHVARVIATTERTIKMLE